MEINPAVREQLPRLGNGARTLVRIRTEDTDREAVWLSQQGEGCFAVVENGSWTLLHPVMIETLKPIEHPGITTLRNLLIAMRWEGQEGYMGYAGDGKWNFGSTSIGQVEPEQLNALFELVGIVPDRIESLGHCSGCVFARPNRAKDGEVWWSERGYSKPCVSCKRPRMSNFKPRAEPFVQCAATKEFGGATDSPVRLQCLCPDGHHPGSTHVVHSNGHVFNWNDDDQEPRCNMPVGTPRRVTVGPKKGTEFIVADLKLEQGVWWAQMNHNETGEWIRVTWTGSSQAHLRQGA